LEALKTEDNRVILEMAFAARRSGRAYTRRSLTILWVRAAVKWATRQNGKEDK
jgi:hypothetical protein